jgi:hypothetical protein
MNKYLSLVLLILITSCRNTAINQKHQTLDYFKLNTLRDSINAEMKSIKSAFINGYIPDLFQAETFPNHNLPFDTDDINKYNMIPMVPYTIDYSTLMSWKNNEPIEPLLKTRNNQADCFIANEQRLMFLAVYTMSNSNWTQKKIGPLSTQFANSISSKLFENKAQLFTIYVQLTNTPTPRETNFIVYDQNHVLTVILYPSGNTEPFKISLEKLQKKLQNSEMI